MHFTDLPKVGDTVTGVVTAVVGAQAATDDDGNEVTRARFEVELADALETVEEAPQEPAGGVEPHAGEPEPKVTSNETPNREAKLAELKRESAARAGQKVKEQQTHADQNEVNEAGDKAAKSVDVGSKSDGSPKTTINK